MLVKKHKKLNYSQLIIISLSGLLCLSLSSCSFLAKSTKTSEETDGAPLVDKDVSKIPNAKPKKEPLSRYGNPSSYTVFGKEYNVLRSSDGFKEKGTASWYGTKFHGKRTSSGETYDVYGMTAAHKTLPLPTYVKVKNLENGEEIIVKVNDRGPFIGDRIIDLSYSAAKKLKMHKKGTANVLITAINPKTKKGYNAPVDVSHSVDYYAENDLPPNAHNIYVQLGAFKEKNNAERLAGKATSILKDFSDKINIHETKLSNLHNLYKVRLGPFYNKWEAEELKTKIANNNFTNATLIYD